jgi:hypothetical protein
MQPCRIDRVEQERTGLYKDPGDGNREEWKEGKLDKDTPLEVGVAMGRRAVDYIKIPAIHEMTTQTSAGNAHGPHFALGWPNPAEDSMILTSAYDLSVPLATLHLACQTATEVVRIKAELAETKARLSQCEEQMKEQSNTLQMMLQAAPLPIHQVASDGDDGDDSHCAQAQPVHVVELEPVVHAIDQESRPVTRSIDRERRCLLLGEEACIPLSMGLMAAYMPPGAVLPADIKEKKVFVQAVRRELPKEKALGTYRDWKDHHKDFRQMFGDVDRLRIPWATIVYPLDVFKAAVDQAMSK